MSATLQDDRGPSTTRADAAGRVRAVRPRGRRGVVGAGRTSPRRRTQAARPSCTRAARRGVLLRTARRRLDPAPTRVRSSTTARGSCTTSRRRATTPAASSSQGADAAKDYGGWAPADYAAGAGHGACAEVLRQLARPPQTPKTPHGVDHLEREVEKRQAVEQLAAAQKARKDAEADLDDALRRVDVLEAEAAAYAGCDARRTTSRTGARASAQGRARIAQLERELAATRS